MVAFDHLKYRRVFGVLHGQLPLQVLVAGWFEDGGPIGRSLRTLLSFLSNRRLLTGGYGHPVRLLVWSYGKREKEHNYMCYVNLLFIYLFFLVKDIIQHFGYNGVSRSSSGCQSLINGASITSLRLFFYPFFKILHALRNRV